VPMSWRLTPAQTDLVWQFLGLGDYPFPIQVRSHGGDEAERSVLRRGVREELRVMGLLSVSDRLEPEFKTVLRLLVRAELWIDSVWFPDELSESPVRTLAMSSGHVALLATQLPGESAHEGGDLLLREIHPSGLVAAVLGELPPAPPGRLPAVAMPAMDLGPQRRREEDDGFGSVMVAGSPRTTRAARELKLLQDIVGAVHPRAGQIAANRRDGQGRKHRSAVLRWCDNADDGRYLLHAGRHVTLEPADGQRLGARIEQAVASTMR
jgi:EspG family